MPDVGLYRLNRLTLPKALKALGTTCGSSSWCFKMASGRPYPTRADLLRFCDLKFRSLTRNEWLEVFAHQTPLHKQADAAEFFSPDELAEFQETSKKYRRRFGHDIVMHRDAQSASQLVSQARRRLRHDPYDELVVSGEHQGRITKEKLIVLLDELERTAAEEDMPVERESSFIKARGRAVESDRRTGTA